MDLNREREGGTSVEETARAISTMEVRGAGRIGRAASRALSDLANVSDAGTADELREELKDGASLLYSTRPTAVSLKNAIVQTLMGTGEERELEGLRRRVLENSLAFIEGSERALERISTIGADMVPEGSTVLTHCNSTAALSVVERAYKNDRLLEVFCTESRPWRQGHITSRWLAARGIPVTMIVDSAVNHMMDSIDMVLVGADTITCRGELYNKIGTSQVALSARENGVPFHSCAESYKLSFDSLSGTEVLVEDRGPVEVADPLHPDDLPGVSFRNPVFDMTPPHHITSFIMEVGSVKPAGVHALMKGIIRETASGKGSEWRLDWLED